MIKTTLCATFACALTLAAAPAVAQTVSGPTSTSPFAPGQEAGGVRYRELSCNAAGGGSCNDAEVFLGSRLGTVGGPYAQQQNSYNQNGTTAFTFSYNAGSDTLTSILRGQTLNYANFSGNFGAGQGPLDTLAIFVRDGETGGSIGATDLFLNGTSLGSFAGADNSLRFWTVTGFDFGSGFTLTGNLSLGGTLNASAELNRVEFLLGSSGAVPEPATWAMMIGGFGLVGGAMRRRRANLAIA